MSAGRAIDVNADPHWKRTGYRYFPYAAQQSGSWWVLRINTGFPEHDMFTVFIDGRAVSDITGSQDSDTPLVASVGALEWPSQKDGWPALESATAAAVVGEVAQFVEYGSEHGEECMFCSHDRDGMTRDG